MVVYSLIINKINHPSDFWYKITDGIWIKTRNTSHTCHLSALLSSWTVAQCYHHITPSQASYCLGSWICCPNEVSRMSTLVPYVNAMVVLLAVFENLVYPLELSGSLMDGPWLHFAGTHHHVSQSYTLLELLPIWLFPPHSGQRCIFRSLSQGNKVLCLGSLIKLTRLFCSITSIPLLKFSVINVFQLQLPQ